MSFSEKAKRELQHNSGEIGTFIYRHRKTKRELLEVDCSVCFDKFSGIRQIFFEKWIIRPKLWKNFLESCAMMFHEAKKHRIKRICFF